MNQIPMLYQESFSPVENCLMPHVAQTLCQAKPLFHPSPAFAILTNPSWLIYLVTSPDSLAGQRVYFSLNEVCDCECLATDDFTPADVWLILIFPLIPLSFVFIKKEKSCNLLSRWFSTSHTVTLLHY